MQRNVYRWIKKGKFLKSAMNIENIVITIKYLQMIQISALNNP